MNLTPFADVQYSALCNRILNEGVMINNERTGKGTLTVINANMIYEPDDFPLITTRKSYWKAAIGEIMGYLRGYTNAQDFADLGVNTWFANANENQAWLNNPNRKGKDDMGRVYGAQMRDWKVKNTTAGATSSFSLDQLQKVIDDLKAGKDDRGEMLMMWNPGEFHLGCLRPCVYNWQFSVLDGKLYVNAYQRSCDVPLGLNFNQIQVWFMMMAMARITGLEPGRAYHNIVNAHIYEDQIDLMKVQAARHVIAQRPQFHFGKDFSEEDLLTKPFDWFDFSVTDYSPHPAIKYPFSV